MGFIEDTGTYSFPMYWDSGFDSWAPFGVVGQPAGALVTPDGDLVEVWSGAAPEDQILEMIEGI